MIQPGPSRTRVVNSNGQISGGQPPPFRATGKGFFNKLPHFPALSGNANASLENLIAKHGSPFRKLYLFVSAVETGWELSGQATQSQTARAFYPRNLSQDELIIEGMVANQFEYDVLVRWIHFHQVRMVTDALDWIPKDADSAQFPGVVFQLHGTPNSKISTHPPMRYMVVVTNVQSGHSKGQMVGLPFQLTCKVIYDYLSTQVDIEQQIDTLRNIRQVFGKYENAEPFGGWEELVQSIINGAQVADAQAEGHTQAAKNQASERFSSPS